MTITRRSLLSGTATALGAAAAGVRPGRADAAVQSVQGPSPGAQVTNISIPFGPNGLMGDSKETQAYAEQVIRAAVVPPLSEIGIYCHGWLTDLNNLMLIYDMISQGITAELRTLEGDEARAAAEKRPGPPLDLPTTSLVIFTHWPSRQSEFGGPIGIADLLSFDRMEARANLVGGTGMALLLGLIWERLLANPDLAGTRLFLAGHSLGCRVLATALETLPTQAPETFAALQTRNRINLALLQPAMPADALAPTDLTQAHPFGQLANYQNLRVLTTMSRWDPPLDRFYPAQEAQQPSDAVYATASPETRQAVPALGGAGPSVATWQAFNGALPRSVVPVGPEFRYTDVVEYADQRLVVADLSPLHAAHRHVDMTRSTRELPPFGRPDRRSMTYSGYHTDIYSREIYQLLIGFAWAQHRS